MESDASLPGLRYDYEVSRAGAELDPVLAIRISHLDLVPQRRTRSRISRSPPSHTNGPRADHRLEMERRGCRPRAGPRRAKSKTEWASPIPRLSRLFTATTVFGVAGAISKSHLLTAESPHGDLAACDLYVTMPCCQSCNI